MPRAEPTIGKPRVIDWWVVAPLVLVVGGYALRLWHVTDPSVSGDEVNSLSFATRPLADLFSALATFEPHPPFYYTFLHFWVSFAGQTELALRLPSVLFSTFGVACGYSAGRDIGGRRAGLATAAIFALSQYSILHAQDARMYAALQAWVALSLAGLVRFQQRPTRTSGLVVVLGGTLACLTHYHGLLPVGFGALAVLLTSPRRELIRRLTPFVAIALVFLPWIIFARRIFTDYPGWMQVVPPADVLRRSLVAYSLGDAVGGAMAARVLSIIPFFSVVGLAALAKHRQWRWLVTLLCLGVLPIAAVIVGGITGRPLFHERYLIVMTPAFFAAAGYGLGFLSRSPITGALGWSALFALGVVSLPFLYWPATPRKADFRASVATIEREARLPAVVAISPPQGPGIDYYLRNRLPTYIGHEEASPRDVDAGLTPLVAGGREAWFVRYSDGNWDDPIGNWLEAHAFYLRDRWITQNHIETYALAATDSLVERPITGRVNGAIDLIRARSGPALVRSADPVLVSLTWSIVGSGDSGSLRAAKVSIRLLETGGRRVAMLDRPLINPGDLAHPDSSPLWNGALTVPLDTAPGHYRLEARFYDGGSGQAWTIVDTSGQERDALDLGEVQVDPTSASTPAVRPGG